MTTAKKTTKKKASKAPAKKKASRSRAKGPRALPPVEGDAKTDAKVDPEKPAPPAKPKEIDPKSLEPDEAKKRVAAIYKLEKVVETKRAAHAAAKRAARSAKEALTAAEDALEKEIREQRFGPGPLFSADGKGPGWK